MVALQTKTTFDTFGWDLGGRADFKDDVTIPQDTGRSGDLLFLTLMSKAQNGEMSPLTDVNPALTAASLACGVNGGAIAAYQNADSEFSIVINGIVTDVQVNMTLITALTDIAPAINTALIPLGAICSYNEETNTFYFSSLKDGLPESSISFLSAVQGGTGTDISGATHLNGLTGGTAVVTAATGELSTAEPAGLFGGPDITEAEIKAGDVENQKVMVKGYPKKIVESKIVLENSLTLSTVIPHLGKTIKEALIDILDIVPEPTENDNKIAPVI
jgi:hypothetical protein